MNTAAIKTDTVKTHRGRVWFDLLADNMMVHEGAVPSVMIANGNLAERPCSLILVQPDKNNLYPRAINGEVGLLEGWALADAIHNIVSKDAGSEQKSAIIAIVDVPSQAYGRREEALVFTKLSRLPFLLMLKPDKQAIPLFRYSSEKPCQEHF